MSEIKIGKNLRSAIRGYAEERKQIAKNTVGDVTSRIRSGKPTIFELGLPPGLSQEFGEKTKKERIGSIRKALGNFEVYKKFSETKLLK